MGSASCGSLCALVFCLTIEIVCSFSYQERFMMAAESVSAPDSPDMNLWVPAVPGEYSLNEDSFLSSRLDEWENEYPIETSGLCFNQTLDFLRRLVNRTSFALKMVDAMGKPHSGLATGAFAWLGDYDECVGVSSEGQGDMDYSGKYCLASAMLDPGPGQLPVTFSVGLCFPSGCRSADAQAFVDIAPWYLTSVLRMNLTFIESLKVVCHEPNVLDAKAIVAIVICCLSAALVLLGSAYEYSLTLQLANNTSKAGAKSARAGEYRGQGSDGVNGDLTSAGIRTGAPGNHDDDALLEPSGDDDMLIIADKNWRQKISGVLAKCLLSFSVLTNVRKLLSTHQPKGALSSVNGIRVFSILWVMLGHTFIFLQPSLKNLLWIGDLFQRRSFGAIINATVSVDSFFVMSGLLVTYLTLRELKKREGNFGPKQWLLVYVHRYIRLTPVYMLLLMFWFCLAGRVGDGPVWPANNILDPNCEHYWWTNLLYINNFYGLSGECMAWSWYLANDMQFFIITVPIIYLLYRFPRVGVPTVVCLTLASCLASMVVVGLGQYPMGIGGNTTLTTLWSDHYYVTPWCRYQTYGIGVLAGYFLSHSQCKLRIHWAANLLMWGIAAALCLLPLYGPYDIDSGHIQTSVPAAVTYNGLSRASWGLGVAWVIIACSTGNGGLINDFLSWKAFVPLGRLTYCVYLTNGIVGMIYGSYSRGTIVYNDFQIAMSFFSIIVGNFSAAFIASLLWEGPTLALEKLAFKR